MLLKNLRIWDGRSSGYLEADRLSVHGDRIIALGDTDANERDVRDMRGLTVIPGLIDAHVHLCLNPEIRSATDQGRESRDELLALMRDRVAAMVKHGITSARDLGGGTWAELEIRDAIARGEITGPRLLCSGQPITSVNGHCHFWGGEAANLDDALKVLARQLEHGVDLIKVMATGGNLTPGSTPANAQFDRATVTAIVERASSEGLHVAAHCHGTSGIRIAANARVRTIEHCSWVGEQGWQKNYDDEAVSMMQRNGVFVSPTINLGWQRNVGRAEAEAIRQTNFSKMRAAGVRFVTSTDAGIPGVFHHEIAKCLPLHSHFTCSSALDTLRAATSDCAEALGMAETGQIRAGYRADLLFLDGDPLSDLTVVANPQLVMAGGRFIAA